MMISGFTHVAANSFVQSFLPRVPAQLPSTGLAGSVSLYPSHSPGYTLEPPGKFKNLTFSCKMSQIGLLSLALGVGTFYSS